MFSETSTKFINNLAEWLFVALLLVVAYEYPRLRPDWGAGFVYFCFAVGFAILAPVPRFGRPYQTLGYMALLLALLNYFSTAHGAELIENYQVVFAAAACIAYGAFLGMLIWLPISLSGHTFPLPLILRPLVSRIVMSTAVAFQVAGGVCLSLVLAAHWARMEDGHFGLPWNSFQFAMLFVAILSATVACGLLVARLPSAFYASEFLRMIGLPAVVLVASGLAELALRQSWSLYFFSIVAFTGSFLAYRAVSLQVRNIT